MAMASSAALSAVASGKAHAHSPSLHSAKLGNMGNQSRLSFPRKASFGKSRQMLSVRAEYSDGSRGGSGDFVAGFLLGGAIFGTLAYIYAPQIRRTILNEDEHGFQRPRRPAYYDDGLEKTRQTLNEKIGQLNSAIDKVSSKLLGGKSVLPKTAAIDSEVDAI